MCIGVLTVPAIAYADPIVIYSTGVDASGNLLPDGAVDPHWTVQIEAYDQDTTPTPSGGAFLDDYNGANYIGGPAYRPDPAHGGTNPYGSDTANAGVIAWSAANYSGNVAYVYRTVFDLTGLNAATASIELTYLSDDDGELALNGALIPSTYNFQTGARTYILTGGFDDALNTLDVVAYNQGGPGGVLVRIDSATAAVPEPAAFGIFGLSAIGLLLFQRRRETARGSAVSV